MTRLLAILLFLVRPPLLHPNLNTCTSFTMTLEEHKHTNLSPTAAQLCTAVVLYSIARVRLRTICQSTSMVQIHPARKTIASRIQTNKTPLLTPHQNSTTDKASLTLLHSRIRRSESSNYSNNRPPLISPSQTTPSSFSRPQHQHLSQSSSFPPPAPAPHYPSPSPSLSALFPPPPVPNS